jgi:D-glycero-D-manno-heptose 1,7-bisphosphate phosphatase
MAISLVVLGRDGVINTINEGGTLHADQFEPLAGSMDAIARLTRAGFPVVVATNQQKLGSGELDVDELHDIHEKMLSLVAEVGGSIDSIFFAATGNPEGHGRRQPKVGLLEQIQARYRVPAGQMLLIGDSREDLEAAATAGTKAVLVRTGCGEEMLEELKDFDGVTTYADLAGAVEAILAEISQR